MVFQLLFRVTKPMLMLSTNFPLSLFLCLFIRETDIVFRSIGGTCINIFSIKKYPPSPQYDTLRSTKRLRPTLSTDPISLKVGSSVIVDTTKTKKNNATKTNPMTHLLHQKKAKEKAANYFAKGRSLFFFRSLVSFPPSPLLPIAVMCTREAGSSFQNIIRCKSRNGWLEVHSAP